MNEENIINIAKKAKELGINKCTLGFSTGKDSVVGLDLLLKAGIEVIPIFFYQAIDLDFINENIAMYENFFKVKVVQLPHPALYSHIRHNDWQSLKMTNLQNQIKLKKVSFEYLTKRYLEENNLKGFDFDCNCMKMADSLNRRLLLRKKPDIDLESKIIYLLKYFTDKDVWRYMSDNKIPKTKDYEIFGRSWDGMAYHYSLGVKKYYPNDYDKLCNQFELLPAEIMRFKLFNKHKNK